MKKTVIALILGISLITYIFNKMPESHDANKILSTDTILTERENFVFQRAVAHKATIDFVISEFDKSIFDSEIISGLVLKLPKTKFYINKCVVKSFYVDRTQIVIRRDIKWDDNNGNSLTLLCTSEGYIGGLIYYNNKVYSIESLSKEKQIITEIDQSKFENSSN